MFASRVASSIRGAGYPIGAGSLLIALSAELIVDIP